MPFNSLPAHHSSVEGGGQAAGVSGLGWSGRKMTGSSSNSGGTLGLVWAWRCWDGTRRERGGARREDSRQHPSKWTAGV